MFMHSQLKNQTQHSVFLNSFFTQRVKINNPFMKILKNHIIYYPTPSNINYAWSFGSLAGIFFALQIVTGIFLAMHYTANVELAFWSVEHIMRDVNNGWLLRYMHANGASMISIALYIHIAKAIYYRSYTPGHSRAGLFYTGIILPLAILVLVYALFASYCYSIDRTLV